MRGRGANSSIVATPVLVGAVTTLITIVAVLLAYNANKGLPFVPTYNVSAEIPGGANLVVSNDVRVGGFRVGFVNKIRPGVEPRTNKAIAIVDMKLDKKIEPLPKDTRVFVRPRSNLGLKYIELTIPSKATAATWKQGDTIPLKQSQRPIELDEYFSLFNQETRNNQQRVFEGFGNALAGRGEDINIAIERFVPFFTSLEPVMTTLSDPRTRLGEFFRQNGRLAAQIAPVAETYADLFENMATTFAALGRDEGALRRTIERSPRTLEQGIRSFPNQRPFLADSERLFRHLRPVAAEFERSLPAATDALSVGRRVVPRAPALYRRTEEVFRALIYLVDEPTTLLGLKDLTRTVKVLAPLVRYVAPYQTVCNYWNYYWTAIGEHVSEPYRFGTIQRVQLKSDNRTQDNRWTTSEADRPGDVPDKDDPQRARDPAGEPLVAARRTAYFPAIDSQGNADCQVGQSGFLDGPLSEGNRYPPSDDPNEGGGSHVVFDGDYPGLVGPTYKGLKSLKDVK